MRACHSVNIYEDLTRVDSENALHNVLMIGQNLLDFLLCWKLVARECVAIIIVKHDIVVPTARRQDEHGRQANGQYLAKCMIVMWLPVAHVVFGIVERAKMPLDKASSSG